MSVRALRAAHRGGPALARGPVCAALSGPARARQASASACGRRARTSSARRTRATRRPSSARAPRRRCRSWPARSRCTWRTTRARRPRCPARAPGARGQQVAVQATTLPVLLSAGDQVQIGARRSPTGLQAGAELLSADGVWAPVASSLGAVEGQESGADACAHARAPRRRWQQRRETSALMAARPRAQTRDRRRAWARCRRRARGAWCTSPAPAARSTRTRWPARRPCCWTQTCSMRPGGRPLNPNPNPMRRQGGSGAGS